MGKCDLARDAESHATDFCMRSHRSNDLPPAGLRRDVVSHISMWEAGTSKAGKKDLGSSQRERRRARKQDVREGRQLRLAARVGSLDDELVTDLILPGTSTPDLAAIDFFAMDVSPTRGCHVN